MLYLLLKIDSCYKVGRDKPKMSLQSAL